MKYRCLKKNVDAVLFQGTAESADKVISELGLSAAGARYIREPGAPNSGSLGLSYRLAAYSGEYVVRVFGESVCVCTSNCFEALFVEIPTC